MTGRLLIIAFSTLVGDARVLKQIDRLARDYEVHTVGYGPAPAGVAGHVQVPDTLAIWRYDRASVVLRRFARAYWSNPAIDFARAALDGSRWDVVLANDIDTVGLALALEPTRGVHADLHEYAPRLKEDVPRWRLFIAPLMRWMCRQFLVRAASVTTVSHGIAAEYAREFGIEVGVVTNAAPYADLEPGPAEWPIRLVHSGACLRDRRLHIMAEAVEASRARVTLDFYLTPNDPDYMRELTHAAQGSTRVTVHDAVPYTDLVTTLNGYDVGLFILEPVNFNYANALPNKFFDFVQARLGIVIGPSPEMAAILTRHGLGAVTQGFDAASVARALDELTPDAVMGWKHRSDAAARELSSESQVELWADAIDRLMGASG